MQRIDVQASYGSADITAISRTQALRTTSQQTDARIRPLRQWHGRARVRWPLQAEQLECT
jgi:hypothetical protein